MYLSMFSILLPAWLGVVLFRKLSVQLRILVILVLILCSFELIAYLCFILSVNNLYLHHIYTFIEFGSLALIYFKMSNSNTHRRIIVGASFVFLTSSVISLFLFEDWNEFNSIQRIVEFVILSIFISIYIRNKIRDTTGFAVEYNPYMLLSIGLAIYFLGTALLFALTNRLIKANILTYWLIHGGLNIFLNIIYSIVIWKGSKVSDY